MLRQLCIPALIVAALLTAANTRLDEFTPVVVSALAANLRPVPGTDGRVHLVYELVLTNANPTPATVEKIEVLDGSNPSRVLATFAGQPLLSHLRTTGNTTAENSTIEFNGTRLLLINFTLESGSALPELLLHHLEVHAAPSPNHQPATPVPLSYTAAPLNVFHKLPRIGRPLSDKGWVAFNGCCGVTGAHRSTGLTVNGKIYFAQRFAIDWVRLDEAGRLVHDDPSDVHNYPDYGADVLSVADGTVVDTLETLEDQKPGTLPDPKTITLQNVDGNHLVLDLGNGVFAFYAHLQKDSVRVAVGERVMRGQVLGKLGNTGNTSGPHLHFHLMDGPSVLGSNGIPYLLSSFQLAGQVSEAQFVAAYGMEGDWGKGLLRTAIPRHDQFPLDLNIIDFPSAK